MKKLLLYGFCLISVVITSTSCKPVYEKVINEEYSSDNTIHICEYLFVDMKQRSLFRFDYSAPNDYSDSVFEVFNNSFEKLNIDYILHKSSNAVDSFFLSKKYNASYRHPPIKHILDIAKSCRNKVVLVPFFSINHGVLPAEAGPTYYDRISFVAFIVKNNEIIYAYNYIVQSKSFFSGDNDFTERPFNLLTEEDWDELVKGAMQPYLERLK